MSSFIGLCRETPDVRFWILPTDLSRSCGIIPKHWVFRSSRFGEQGNDAMKVALDNGSSERKYVEFDTVPLKKDGEFRCIPDGILSPELAVQVAQELAAGRISGRVNKYHWYRQAGG
jgi:hypothetical protein